MVSLANALVRDGTARFFRWKRGAEPTRVSKIPLTQLSGRGKLEDIPDHFHRVIQSNLQCGCRMGHCVSYRHNTAQIGGKSFNAGERLRVGVRCGSVVTMIRGGRSVYGLVKKFYRVTCRCHLSVDFAVVSWFPPPVYPDGDPLTVKIVLGGMDINNIVGVNVVPLFDIHPSRIAVEIDGDNDCMYMLRIDGTDTMPTT